MYFYSYINKYIPQDTQPNISHELSGICKPLIDELLSNNFKQLALVVHKWLKFFSCYLKLTNFINTQLLNLLNLLMKLSIRILNDLYLLVTPVLFPMCHSGKWLKFAFIIYLVKTKWLLVLIINILLKLYLNHKQNIVLFDQNCYT